MAWRGPDDIVVCQNLPFRAVSFQEDEGMSMRVMVRERRLSLRLSLVEVARRMGVTAAMLSQYETGKNNIGFENARKLSAILGLSIEQLMDNEQEKRPLWLDVLTERHGLGLEEQEVLLSVAREAPVNRGAEAVRENENTIEHWEMVYQSLKPYMPKRNRSDCWQNNPDVRRVLMGLGVPRATSLDEVFEAIDRQVERFCDGVEFRNLNEFKEHMLSALGVRVERLQDGVDLTDMLHEFASMGLFRAISDCTMFAKNEFSCGGTYVIRNGVCADRFLVLIDERGTKKWRSEFTLWHELAHIVADPNVMLGTVATAAESRSDAYDMEWLMDRIAGRLAFWPRVFSSFYETFWRRGLNLLSYEGMYSLRKEYNPAASKTMTAVAIVDYVSEPAVYLEAELKSKRNCATRELRLSYIHANAAADKANIRFGKNMRVPTGSVISRRFDGKGEQDESAIENLKNWSFSSGETLNERVVRIQARHHRDSEGQDRVYAFVTIPCETGV